MAGSSELGCDGLPDEQHGVPEHVLEGTRNAALMEGRSMLRPYY